MEEQTAKLFASFKKFEIPEEKVDEFGDKITLGNCWVYDELHQVEFWSMVVIPTTNKLGFMTKWKNSRVSLPVSPYEEVVDISEGENGFIFLKTVMNDLE